ncbi:MAG: hypothetical protein F6K55_31860 [Moorea sp. SIO4A3]|nr:hypothetical protein [Moorena sp. SIO4A3]
MQRGLGEAARSWGGSAVLGRQRGLGGSPHSRFAVVPPTRALPWFPRGKQRCVHVVSPKENRGVPHTAPPHERLPWFPPLALCIKTGIHRRSAGGLPTRPLAQDTGLSLH